MAENVQSTPKATATSSEPNGEDAQGPRTRPSLGPSSGDPSLEALESQVNSLLSPNYYEVLDSTPEAVLWDPVGPQAPSSEEAPPLQTSSDDWWKHPADTDEDLWEIDDSLEEGLGLYIQETLEHNNDTPPTALEPECDTLPGLEIDGASGLLTRILSTAQELDGVYALEILDAQNQPFAEVIVDAGTIACAMFMHKTLVVSDNTPLQPTLLQKIQAMGHARFASDSWVHENAWDWTHTPFDLHQRQEVCVATVQALTTIATSTHAPNATIQPRALSLPSGTTLCFSAAELSMAANDAQDTSLREEPAFLFYLQYANHAQVGGLLKRDPDLPNTLQPLRMVPFNQQPIQHRDKRSLREFGERCLSSQTAFNRNGQGSFQINMAPDGFWAILSTTTRVTLLRFPNPFLGRVWGAMLRLFDEPHRGGSP